MAATALSVIALLCITAGAASAKASSQPVGTRTHQTAKPRLTAKQQAAARKRAAAKRKAAAKQAPAGHGSASAGSTGAASGSATATTGSAQRSKRPTSGLLTTTKSQSSAGSVYWGAVTGTQFDNGGQAPWDMNVVSDFTKADALNKHMSIIPFYSAFDDCSTSPCTTVAFPTTVMESVRKYGAIPMISWGSSSLQDPSYDGVNDKNFTLAGLASGKFDGYITAWAEQAKAFGHPFFLRFDWEMNGNWFVWGGDTNGNSAAEYVAAWRHVHTIFTRVGATNVSWVWCPNNGDNNGSTASMASFYPGNAYVDWTCMDAYNFGATNGGKWETWDDIARTAYDTIQGIAPSKPMMVAEFASDPTGGSQAAWLTQALAEIPADYPNIHAILEYDDSDPRWQLEGHPLSQAAFAAGIQNPAYTTNSYGNLNTSPIPAP